MVIVREGWRLLGFFRNDVVFLIFLMPVMWISGCAPRHPAPPAPFGPVPSAAQLAWHEREYYGFIHFGLNTFTDEEWGYGNTDPRLFNPTDFDADQIVSATRDAGMRGLILTCKHHDGFCLWPSAFTGYSVKNSPWKDGKGDVVKEISEACDRYGVAFGVYLSPWDRNHPDYGKPEYITYYREQLRELLTRYGPVFEVWFDGANGGTGWYGGADEERKIDRLTYYDWEHTWQMVRELQPGAVIFSDVGPDIRWVGNEAGEAGDPCWATYTPEGRDGLPAAPGQTDYLKGQNGQRNGRYWMPAECDVSIRPGWFYHASQDSLVKSPEKLFRLYVQSVGRGASLLLNLPPDTRGQIPEADIQALQKFRRIREDAFREDLALKATVTASNFRGSSREFSPGQVADLDRNTYWCTDDTVANPELILEFPHEVTFSMIRMEEYLPLGQRVNDWVLECREEGRWVEFARGISIGSARIWSGEAVTTNALKIRFPEINASPAIRRIAVYP